MQWVLGFSALLVSHMLGLLLLSEEHKYTRTASCCFNFKFKQIIVCKASPGIRSTTRTNIASLVADLDKHITHCLANNCVQGLASD
jgi:hypothetical protein